jgi:non-ribosomal peptide synthetase component F
MLDDYNPPSIRFSCKRKPVEGHHNATVQLQTPLSQEDGDSNALAAAIAVCFGQWSSVQDILLGRLELGGLVPVRVKWKPLDTWNQLLQSVVVGNEPLSQERLASALRLERDQEPFAAVLATSSHDGLQSTEEHPIRFQLSQDGRSLALHANIDRLAPAVSELCLQLIDKILLVLRSAGTNKIGAGFLGPDSPLLSVDSREPHLLPPYKHVMQWVDDRAREQPDVPSVIYYEKIDPSYPKQQLTYHELSVYSSQMAELLTGLGITSGDKIAVCMKRNLDFHVSLLAILKAGACYVPVSSILLRNPLLGH